MMSSITDLSNAAFRHVFRFADARTLAAAECLMPRLAQVARAAVVEVADARYGMTLEAEAGCAWKLLVQEGLAGPGGVGLAVGWRHQMLVDTEGRARGWGACGRGTASCRHSRPCPSQAQRLVHLLHSLSHALVRYGAGDQVSR